jgi:aminoglycoside phosphotransferase family enzyme/predicted kinase
VGIESLPDGLIEDLARPDAYPDDPSARAGVETLQTHISHLFLTPARVVKVRKAVELSFLDFSTRARRVADCHAEVALNRRLAKDVYLGVAPVLSVSGHFQVSDGWAPDDEAGGFAAGDAECAVVMRRLESGRDALSLLEQGLLRPEDLDAVARSLAKFHEGAGLGCPAPWEPDAWWQHCLRPAANTLASLRASAAEDAALRTRIDALEAATLERFEQLREPLERRRREGRAVDAHGDLHLQHIWFERGAAVPAIIDCLEFDADLRRIDSANEVAFLAMDLAYRGRTDLAAHFLGRYAAARDDFGLFEVVDAYQSYRAAVRAKVAALAAVDATIPTEQQAAARESVGRHLTLAERAIRGTGGRTLILVCGTVGVGKSRVAEKIAERTGGVAISSDRTRKSLAGIPADAHPASAPDAGLYTPERTDAVYEALLDRAASVVSSGRVAVLDATFGRRVFRDRARSWATRRGLDALLVHVDCAEAQVRERVGRRAALGTDPSDAGPEFVSISRSRFEAPTEWPEQDRFALRTDRGEGADFVERLASRVERPS